MTKHLTNFLESFARAKGLTEPNLVLSISWSCSYLAKRVLLWVVPISFQKPKYE